MITAEQLKDVVERTEKLHHYLNIDQKKVEFEEEQLRTQAPDFWDDPIAAQEQMKKVKGIEKWLKGYKQVSLYVEELSLAFEYYKEELVSEEEVDNNYGKAITAIEDLELKNMLRREEDSMDAVMKINSGAGGTESQDWAQMLMRMYMRWCEAQGHKVTITDLQEGDEAGIKSVTMTIEGGEYAYGFLKSENGAGGQNVNKVESGVRLRYQYEDPDTGEKEEILIENTETRDQPKNRAKAMLLLKSQLYDRALKKKQAEQAKIEAGKKKIEWGSQIRSYVFDDRRVKDHRTNFQTSDVDGVMDGKIDGFIKAYLMEFHEEAE